MGGDKKFLPLRSPTRPCFSPCSQAETPILPRLSHPCIAPGLCWQKRFTNLNTSQKSLLSPSNFPLLPPFFKGRNTSILQR
jgi:hypothetical protein